MMYGTRKAPAQLLRNIKLDQYSHNESKPISIFVLFQTCGRLLTNLAYLN